MVNLNRQRIAVYFYFLIVFGLIFGLSFAVKGDRITGNFILGIARDFFGSVDLALSVLILFGFLISLAFSLFVIRHAQEIKREINHAKLKPIAGVMIIMLIFSFLSFGVFFSKEDKITGAMPAIDNLDSLIKGMKKDDVIIVKRDGNVIYGGKNIGILSQVDMQKIFGTSERELRFAQDQTFKINEKENEKFVERIPFLEAVSSDKDTGIIKYRFGTETVYEKNGKIYSDADAKTRSKDARIIKAVENKKEQENKFAAELVWTLLDLTLGKFAYGYVAEYCKDQYDSSDYPKWSPAFPSSANIQSPPAGSIDQETEAKKCIGDKTTLALQAKKSIVGSAFEYQMSWTIMPCKENVQYTIYLANSVDDRIGITSGVASKNIAKSESSHFSYAKSYKLICIQVSDTLIGDNGYACFDIA